VNYKVLLLTAFISVNANANVFTDVGDWVSDNKGTTAMIGISNPEGSIILSLGFSIPLIKPPLFVVTKLVSLSKMCAICASVRPSALSVDAILSSVGVQESLPKKGILKGAKDALKGVKNRIFKGVSDERL
jgi:hypothetical protein